MAEEARLSKWVLHMSRIGFGQTRREIKQVNRKSYLLLRINIFNMLLIFKNVCDHSVEQSKTNLKKLPHEVLTSFVIIKKISFEDYGSF